MSDPLTEGPEARRARRRRNLLLGLALIAFCVLVYTVTIIRLGANVSG